MTEPHSNLVETIQNFHRRGWCDGTGGNFSLVVSRDPLRLLMAPSGVDKGQVRPEQLIEVDANGSVVSGQGRASAETLMHLTIVNICGSGAVLHTHSSTATLLSQRAKQAGKITLEGWEMLKGLKGISTHEARVSIPVIANDQDLKRLSRVAASLAREAPHALLVAGHGLYAWGENLTDAQRHVEIIEFLLELHWKQQLIDKQ